MKKDYRTILKEFRQSLGMSLRAAAEKSGLQPIQLSKIERCLSDPRVSTISKLCTAYGITIAEVFDLAE